VVSSNRVTASSGAFGGGIYETERLVGCEVSDNVAESSGDMAIGGGVFMDEFSPSIAEQCVVRGNAARTAGSGSRACAKGGAAQSGTWRNCTIADNVAEGETAQGGGLQRTTAVSCEMSGNRATTTLADGEAEGGGAHYSELTGCVVSNNEAQWGGGTYSGSATGCTIIGNRADTGGGACYGTLVNCIVTKNHAATGGGWYPGSGSHNTFTLNETDTEDSYSPAWGANNTLVWGEKVAGVVQMPSVGPTKCPMADPENGDYRLVAGSEAIDAGNPTTLETDLAGNPRTQGAAPDLGALEAERGGVCVAGLMLVVSEGSGGVEVAGGDGGWTATALDWGRPFLGWKIDGAIVSTERTYNFADAAEGGTLTAVFGAGDIWVDAEEGHDGNCGSEASPLKTLQAAANLACEGDTVRAKPGTYGRFWVMGKHIDIVGAEGAESTAIDAQWQGRCAMLGNADASPETNRAARLRGFTLRRGTSQSEGHWSGEGAAVLGGEVEDCVIEDCGRWSEGTGDQSVIRDAGLARCVVRGCLAGAQVYDGSGNQAHTNRDTLVTGNRASAIWQSAGNENRNLTIAGNKASEAVLSGGTYWNCIAWGNGTTTADDWSGGWNCIEEAEPREAAEGAGPIWTDNPEFVDGESGDFRLSAVSPYVDAGSNEKACAVGSL
ncbi:MAG: hypothetical protein J6Y19_01325, partial [Kiritimatiellae bacterium]|nr:hypothetical protein [Kiritimatiellia bacterium]